MAPCCLAYRLLSAEYVIVIVVAAVSPVSRPHLLSKNMVNKNMPMKHKLYPQGVIYIKIYAAIGYDLYISDFSTTDAILPPIANEETVGSQEPQK